MLHPAKSELNRGINNTAHPNYRPIRWGQRLYLLADGDMLPFCNAVNLGLEPRQEIYGKSYVNIKITKKAKRGEEFPLLQKVEGLPGLPKRWEPFLLRRPPEGSVIEVLKDKRARIHLGSDDGLKVGMELFVFGEEKSSSGRSYGIANVIVVEAHRCIAEVKRPEWFDGFKRKQKVSSRIPKEIFEDESVSFWW